MKKKQGNKSWLGFWDWLAAYSACRDMKVIEALDC